MKPLPFLIIVTFLCLIVHPQIISGKKKKKKSKNSPKSVEDEFKESMKLLKCLVCQNLVTEFETAISRTDPKVLFTVLYTKRLITALTFFCH